MTMQNKNRKFLTEFIEAYRLAPSIWKIKSEAYLNRRLKAESYKKLVAKLKEIDPTATRETARKLINNLRARCRKESRRLKKVKEQGEYPVRTKLWFYNLFEFLRSENDLKHQNYCRIDFGPVSSNVSSLPEQQSNSKYIVKNTYFDEAKILGTRWAVECATLTKEQRIFAEKAINDIFYYAKLNALQKNSLTINNWHQINSTKLDEEEKGNSEDIEDTNRRKGAEFLCTKERFKIRCCVDVVPLSTLSETCLDYETAFKMKHSTFIELLNLVTPYIKKADTLMKDSIMPSQRLAATLYYLISGSTLRSLKDTLNISKQSLSNVVAETCRALLIVLKDYLKIPTTPGGWKKVANDFENKWNFPHCLGAVTGVYLQMSKTETLGMRCAKNECKCNTAFLAIVDSNYMFTSVDIGMSMECTMTESTSKKDIYHERMLKKICGLPESEQINNSKDVLPYVFVSENVLPLSDNIMKPYSRRDPKHEHMVYNYRIRRVHRLAQNAIGLMNFQFGIISNSIRHVADKALPIVLTCCHLHNFLISKNETLYINNGFDKDDLNTGAVIGATWRLYENQLREIEYNQPSNHPYSSKIIREKYCEYFNGAGFVS